MYDKNNKPLEEDIRLKTDTEDVKGQLIVFDESEVALGELKMERQTERMGYQRNCCKQLGAKGKGELYDICNEAEREIIN